MGINWSGKRRWIALLLLIVNIVIVINIKPVIPVIQLPGEIWPGREIFGLEITNTLAGSVIVWILVLLLVAYIAMRRPSSGDEVPNGGLYNFLEMGVEGLYSFVGTITTGQHKDTIFTFFATIFIIVLLSNWLEVIPGVDSIGFLEPHVDADTGEFEDGFDVTDAGAFYYLNADCEWVSPEEAEALTAEEQTARLDKGCVSGTGVAVEEHEDEEAIDGEAADTEEGEEAAEEGEEAAGEEGEEAVVGAEGEEEGEHHFEPGDPNVPWVVLPFIRPPSTDLNMTLAFAFVSVMMTQALGVRALGLGYFTKFFNFKTLFSSPAGGMDVIIGLLEFIGELAKILSFSFRLLGNIFAGSILLFVITFLVPVIAPWALFLVEFFVGIIQAMIFGMLTAIFMNLATISHGDHADEH